MKVLRRYLITLFIGCAGVLAIIALKDIFSQTQPKTVFHILCDAFFAVGVMIECAGLLVFSSNEGTFDMLKYGVGTFMDMFRKNKVRKYETFYDYRASREDKKLKFAYMLICGAVFLAVSLVMYLLYRQY